MSTITTIASGDTIAASRTVINTNFSNLNTDKVQSGGSSTDNAVVRFNGTGGATVQDSSVLISDVNAITGVTALTVDNINLDSATISTTSADTSLTLTPNGTGLVTTAATTVVKSGTAAAAGGAEAIRIGTGATGVVGIYFGSGAPSVSAPKGSLYLRTDGSSTSTRLYVNTDAGTTWTNVTTAA
jgi:hypothetical protein